ncbi:type I polyketide synthase [Kutzneria sp. NPDC052558]|uniref:type I polyketide synthase n=1 Tax=Kutzneria sp. NPDC052558 TaxID=3364121 RepID=UPI0037C8D588
MSPIAVVGVGCRLPGGVDGPDSLWQLLRTGRDAIREGPHDRWDVAAFYAPDQDVPGRMTSRWAGLLDDIAGFDAEFFGISAREARAMDPQARLMLEIAWEALERAGISPRGLEGRPVGVFTGLCHVDYLLRMAGRYDEIEPYTSSGTAHSTAAGRISYLLGLRGPSVAIDAACASSLVAVHLACQSLNSDECDIALAGGANVLVTPDASLSYSQWGMLSSTGRCRPFDAAADGYVRGEGAGMVVLRRLDDALRDGDPVLAVIKGTAVNQDGRSRGLTTPSAEAQRILLRTAVQKAGVPAAAVGMVEAHGPGTPVGDPIEFSALADVYGSGDLGRCALGSLKSNIGHLEAAAGVTGLIKAVLCVRNATVVPTLHFRRWNPEIPAADTRLYVPQEVGPWPVDGPTRIAAVSSFGFSGTNAHAIVESFDQTAPEPEPAAARPRVFVLSAASDQALRESAGRLAERLVEPGSIALRDVAHTLARRRSPLSERLAVVADSAGELVEQLKAVRDQAENLPDVTRATAQLGRVAGPVWVFSGQGTQWAGMGRSLLDVDPAFTAAIDELEPLVRAEGGFSLRQQLCTGEEVVTGIATLQPSLFSMQVALAASWTAQGVRPAAVIGHSMGEVAAAVVSGRLSLADGVRVVCRRSRMLARLSGRGAMAVVWLHEQVVAEELAGVDDVSIAVLSATDSTVIAGATAAVHALVERWNARGVPAKLIKVDVASHSAMVDPIIPELIESLREVRVAPAAATLPAFYTTVLDDPRATPDFDAPYWAANMRQPVRFRHALVAAARDGFDVFVEISPHPGLASAMRSTLTDAGVEPLVVPTLVRGQDGPRDIQRGLGALWAHGVPVDWSPEVRHGTVADLPVTAWNRERHWIDLPLPHPDLATSARSGEGHVFLGPRLCAPPPATGVFWRADLGRDAVPWLSGMTVHGEAMAPLAAFAEIAVAAGAEVLGRPPRELALTGVEVVQMLPLDASTPVYTSVERGADGDLDCTIRSFDSSDDSWTVHATARVSIASAANYSNEMSGHRAERTVTAEALAAELDRRGVSYGPAFQLLDDVHIATEGDRVFARGRLVVSGSVRADRRFHVHPAVLDACLRTLSAALVCTHDDLDVAPLAIALGDLRLVGDPRDAVECRVELAPLPDDSGFQGGFRLLDEAGDLIAHACGVRFARYARGPERLTPLFHELTWTPSPLGPSAQLTGTWTVCASPGDQRAAEAAALLRAAELLDTPLSVEENSRFGEELARSVARRPGDANVLLLLPPAVATPSPQRARELATLVAATARACVVESPGRAPRLWVVASNAHGVLPTDHTDLDQAGVPAIVHVLRHEHPELRATLVDPGRGESAVADLLAELASSTDASVVAWRSGIRFLAQVAPALPRDTEPSTVVSPDGAYLITGGLGAVGLHAAQWLSKKGAGRIVLNGRSAPNDTAAAVIAAMRERGTQVTVVCGDIAHPETARELVAAANADGCSLRGVLHAALTVHDGPIAGLTPADFLPTWQSKVDGAWRLHEATLDIALDWWVTFSSMSAMIGSAGLGSYASANAWLDGLAGWRRAQGLPATSIGWGLWAGTGLARTYEDQGHAALTPADAMDAMEVALLNDFAHVGVFRADAEHWFADQPGLAALALFAPLSTPTTEASATPDSLADRLRVADLAERVHIWSEYLWAQVGDILGRRPSATQPNMPFISLGLDSLGAMRLRQRLASAGVEVPTTAIWKHPTPRQLAHALATAAGSDV